MCAQGGGHEIQQRRRVGEFASGEVALSNEAAVLLVPAHTSPVVETLKWEMDVLIGLEFEDREATVEGAGKDIDHGAVGGSEGGHLRVDEALVEALVNVTDVADDQRFQPALGAETEDGIAALAAGVP